MNLLEEVFWYMLLVFCHLMWGLFPVSCRYLQTQADPPLESMRLGFYVAALAAMGLFCTYTLPMLVIEACCKVSKANQAEVCSSGQFPAILTHSLLQ
jgi:hypothetical protein